MLYSIKVGTHKKAKVICGDSGVRRSPQSSLLGLVTAGLLAALCSEVKLLELVLIHACRALW